MMISPPPSFASFEFQVEEAKMLRKTDRMTFTGQQSIHALLDASTYEWKIRKRCWNISYCAVVRIPMFVVGWFA